MSTETLNMTHPRPWVRFWARLLDITLYSAILTYFLPTFANFNFFWQSHVAIEWQALAHQLAAWGLINLAFYIAIESILLSTIGTTLGKWMLRVSVKNNQGKKLSFVDALKRTFLVYFRGFAFFIPFISFITLIYAYAALSSSGSTSWDKECHITVTHQRIGFFRLLLTLILFIILINAKNTLTMQMMTFKQQIMYFCGVRG